MAVGFGDGCAVGDGLCPWGLAGTAEGGPGEAGFGETVGDAGKAVPLGLAEHAGAGGRR